MLSFSSGDFCAFQRTKRFPACPRWRPRAEHSVQHSEQSGIKASGCKQTAATMVTGADCWLAQTRLSKRHELSGVTRDDLSHGLHPVPRCSEERASCALASYSCHASLPSPYAEDRRPRSDHWNDIHQRASSRSRGPGRTEDTETVVNALIRNARCLPKELYRSLTWDRGKEMAAHRRFTLATDIQVYFCDPRYRQSVASIG